MITPVNMRRDRVESEILKELKEKKIKLSGVGIILASGRVRKDNIAGTHIGDKNVLWLEDELFPLEGKNITLIARINK